MPSEKDRIDLNSRLMSSAPRSAQAPRSSGPVRAKPVRITTDLGASQHRELKEFCDEIASSAGMARVPGSEVVRALLDQLQEDADLRSTIAAAIVQRSRSEAT